MNYKKTFPLLCIVAIVSSGCSNGLWGEYATPTLDFSLYFTATPFEAATLIPTPLPATATPTYDPPTPTQEPSPSPLPTLTGAPKPPVIYYSQSGDSLSTVATRFGVDPSEISSTDPLPASGLLNPGTLMLIPDRMSETTPSTLILPDSEFVYSASALDFDIRQFTSSAGGHLEDYTEYMRTTSHTSGADIVQRLADENSINPRLLLAILEYQSSWVYGEPENLAQEDYPLGYIDFQSRGLFAQLIRAIKELSVGYYDWRSGDLTQLTFPDGKTIRMSPGLNAGSAALQYYFSRHFNYDDWAKAIDPNIGVPALYKEMFGDPWLRDNQVAPLFPPGITQPPLTLPFVPGVIWSYTGGPHAAWELEGALAAIDFAPSAMESGCIPSDQWIVAPASGLVTRSGNGVVVLDLDGDGKEQTGWVLLFLHIASSGRVRAGKFLDQGGYIGHPSCEGGVATGTHVHIARRYNGEWVLADSALPFVMDGWVVHAGAAPYKGTLVRDGDVVTASQYGSYETNIMRDLQP
jgi:murein DD-endopeptidase MepM/ murein hydrolase activator NlpD